MDVQDAPAASASVWNCCVPGRSRTTACEISDCTGAPLNIVTGIPSAEVSSWETLYS